ncbi:MAG: winged helix-turn-helix transcriptional regulator [Thermoproteus sp.]|nr:winged helix-turn-helix transcriptional regulator [Thermoproteus sp.]
MAEETQGVEEETLTEIEVQILQGLERLGGSYQQRNLWKYIGIDSKTGLPILGRLEKRGLIKKERVGGERRGVYIVRLTEKAYKMLSELRERAEEIARFDVGKLSEELRALLTVPCTFCPYIERCGFSFVDPLHCELLTRWSMSLEGHERED